MAVTPQMLEPMARRRCELGREFEDAAQQVHHAEREDEFDGDEGEGEAADVEDVLQKEAGAYEDDA